MSEMTRGGECFGELSVVAEQLQSMCRVLPACWHLGEQFTDLMEDALSDLYVVLEDLSRRFCDLIESSEMASLAPDAAGQIAKALLAEPDRCMDILDGYLEHSKDSRGILAASR